MVYLLVASVMPRQGVRETGAIAAAVAVAVEFFKLVHTPALDAFRLTLAGKLLLGREFGWLDIAAYWTAIAACALVDRSVSKIR